MKISCPHCGQHYEVDKSALGQQASCDNCNKDFVIAAPASPAASPEQIPDVMKEIVEPPQPKPDEYSDSARDVVGDSDPFFDEEMKAFLLKVFLWIRKIAAVICVIVAIFQMYNIQEDRQRTWLYNAHAIYDAGTNTKALVDLMRPVMFMLLALFIKPGRDTK